MTKEQIEQRRATEAKSPDTDIVCPAFVSTEEEQERFHCYAQLIERLGVWSELDADTLGRYVVSQATYECYVEPLRSALEASEYDLADKLQRQQERAFKQARACASDLGMTITGRCKLVVPEADDEPIPDL